MTEHKCQIICRANVDIINDTIRQWWETTNYSKKELVDDSLPKRFYGNFRIGHYRGEDRIHFEFSIENNFPQTKLKIYLLYPEWSPLSPQDTFQDIVCWFILALKNRKIDTELKQEVFARKVICP